MLPKPAPAALTRLVEETGENRATLLKCRQFADLYTADEFRQLCRLRRPDGKPRSHASLRNVGPIDIVDLAADTTAVPKELYDGIRPA